jgi:hypothetical protein
MLEISHYLKADEILENNVSNTRGRRREKSKLTRCCEMWEKELVFICNKPKHIAYLIEEWWCIPRRLTPPQRLNLNPIIEII